MKKKALQSFSGYAVVRQACKEQITSVLKFGYAVLCVRSEVQTNLEVKQQGVGRLNLAANARAPNKAVQVNMGWSNFEPKEVGS